METVTEIDPHQKVSTYYVDEAGDGVLFGQKGRNRLNDPDAYGQMLLPAGTEIQSRHIIVFKTWNIRSVWVRGEGEDLTEGMGEIKAADVGEDIVRLAAKRIRDMGFPAALTP